MAETKSTRSEHRIAASKYAKEQRAKFAFALLKWRTENLLTRAVLAKAVGCSDNQIANIENQNSFPSFSVYVALCREMGQEPLPVFE